MNGTVGIDAAIVSLSETNFSFNKVDTAKSSVFHLLSTSVVMKLEFFFCQPFSRFNPFKKRFGEFRVGQSKKYSRFFDCRSLQTRFLIFVCLDLLDGVQYRLYLLNAKFCRILLFFTSLSNKILFDFASFIFSLEVKALTAVVSASARLSVNISTSCSKFYSSRQCLK